MTSAQWLRQRQGQPLYPDVIWNKPETKAAAGKLLIIGGHSHSFKAPSVAYSAAGQAGAGAVRLLLPDALQKSLGKLMPEAEFAPSTLSGGFSRQAAGQAMEAAAWADGVLLAGDFGQNSETVLFIETFLRKCPSLTVSANDSLGTGGQPNYQPNHCLVTTISQLQQHAKAGRWPLAITSGMTLSNLAAGLAEMTNEQPYALATRHAGQLVVASGGQASSTPANMLDGDWAASFGAYAGVWWLQQPADSFKALTCAAYDFLNTGS